VQDASLELVKKLAAQDPSLALPEPLKEGTKCEPQPIEDEAAISSLPELSRFEV
jgi:hypothetical protein